MAALRILTGVNAGERAELVPRHQWRQLVEARANHCNRGLREDCRALAFYINDASANDWLGFDSFDAYVRDGLCLDLEVVQWAIDGLRKLDGQHAVRLNDAVTLGKQGAPVGNNNAAKDKNKGSNTTFELGRGATYTLARLTRDRPDLAAEVKAGKLSANAAAIRAGFRRKTWTAPCDPELLAAAIELRFPGYRLVRSN